MHNNLIEIIIYKKKTEHARFLLLNFPSIYII